MALSSTIVTMLVSALLGSILNDETTEALCIGFDESQVVALIEVINEMDDPPVVKLLTSDSVVKWMREDFVLASEAVALIEAEKLSIRTTTGRQENVLVVCEDALILLDTGVCGDKHYWISLSLSLSNEMYACLVAL